MVGGYSLKAGERKGLMSRRGAVAIAAIVLLFLASASPANPPAQTVLAEARETLRNRLEFGGLPLQCSVGQEIICASMVLPRFYELRAYELAWIGDEGPLPCVDDLIRAIRQADREGLRPEDYHLADIEAKLQEFRQDQQQNKPPGPRELVDLDLLLTDAFLLYASHLLAGKVNPESLDAEWIANRREADLAAVLQSALETERIQESLEGLLPQHPGYARLREALLRYDAIAARGGWTTVPDSLNMEKGDRGVRVSALRKRLVAEGYLDGGPQPDEELFDEAFDRAVREFQLRHGLGADGIVGPLTLKALNVPVESRLLQLRVNMERWRWLPQDLGERYVLVNIAAFELVVVEGYRPFMTMLAIVGKPYRRTPVFSDRITYVVFNPHWNIPPRIAVQDKLPLIRKDPGYLAEHNIRVLEGWGAETREIEPSSIDWSHITARSFHYRLRQDPGPMNALGRLKFMFPNRFNVYLHDTPSREFFSRTVRTFSSGCIRIQKPLDLAEYLLRDDPAWNREKIVAAIGTGVEQTVRLTKPVPVHLLYWTAWAGEDPLANFVDDIYGRDILVAEAFATAPPAPD